ncbi:ATP-binding protein [Pantoea sp. ME81]|uniref:AAA family ATPase n=1 Tax=Pantoea sp. ME81 TaxID=2743935 RepID=UPI002102C93F|nr:ATP-binding protein [Pantoea sp. ME81]
MNTVMSAEVSQVAEMNYQNTKMQQWILRILFRLGAHKQFITQHGFSSQPLADYLHLNNEHSFNLSQQDQDSLLKRLRKYYQDAEQYNSLTQASIFQTAVSRFATRIGLNSAEKAILEFTLQLHQERLLDDVTEWLGPLTSSKVYRTLAMTLDITETEVREALGPSSTLTKTGLVSLEMNGAHLLRNKLEPFSPTLAERLYSGETSPARLLQGMINICGPAHLKLDNYAHIPAVNILRQWLHHALSTQRIGVNILIHGQPGSGKSQLCRLIANELQTPLYEVSSENESLRPISGSRRLRAWRAAQRLFIDERAIILLDEAEDVFVESPGIHNSSPLPLAKAWINRLLEENVVPTLWVANDIDCMDPAMVRRFDMVIELNAPPRNQRAEIIQEACGEILAPGALALLAEASYLAPAVINRAANVLAGIGDKLSKEKCSETLMYLINNTLKAQGHKPIKNHVAAQIPAFYDTAFINCDNPLDEIGKALTPGHSARFCLYGPSGTGKTAWAHWLAKQLDKVVIERKASQLFGRYVGESEQNIAALFEQAQRDNAILLIDEIDSFLSARDEFQHHWQVSSANEMLSQMALFEGVLIATTNRFDVLDDAALRRFDLKVRFNYLCDDQAAALLNIYYRKLQLNEPQSADMKEISKLDYLTPGDFALVARQHHFKPVSSTEAFVAALKAECWMKKREKPAIGFLH